MKINSINSYNFNNKNYSPSFGMVQLRPQPIQNFSADDQMDRLYPKNFQYSTLKTVFAHPEFLTPTSMQTISYKILKDIRKSQQEADQYLGHVIQFHRDFMNSYKDDPSAFEDGASYDDGKLKVEHIDYPFDNGESTFILNYSDKGSLNGAFKMTNEQLTRIYFAARFPQTGKMNYADFREDGSVKEIGVGLENATNGAVKKQKVYEYDEKCRLVQCAQDVVHNPDGSIEMKNYFRLNPYSSEYIDKYAAKRTVNTNGSTTYENVIFYDRKSFWKYFPEKTFAQIDEHRILTDEDFED